jgi:PAS domain S-box-containing protein
MDYRFEQLVDIAQVRDLLDTFYQATGIPHGLIDMNGQILSGIGWQSICAEFHACHPDSEARCRASNQQLRQAVWQGQWAGHQCQNGLMDYAVPIIVQDKVMAILMLGQLLHEPPDREFFLARARELEFDEDAYMAALDKVPIIPKARIEPILQFFNKLAKVLAEQGLQRMKQLENERLLIESNERLQMVVGNAPFVISIFDTQGRFTLSEGAGLADLGLKPGQVVGAIVWDLYADVPSVIENAKEALKGQPRRFTCTLSGHIYDTQFLPLFDEQGSVQGCLNVAQDITAQHTDQAARRLAEERLEAVLEQLPAAVWVVDENMRFTFKRGAGLPLLGLQDGGFDAGTLMEFLGQHADQERVLNAHARALGGQETGFTLQWNTTYLETKLTPLRNAQGQVTGVLGVALDATPRRRAEAVIAAEKERLEVTLKGIADAVLVTDEDGHLTMMNPAAESLLGLQCDQAMGLWLSDLFQPRDADSKRRLDSPLARVLQGKSAAEPGPPALLVHDDGIERLVHYTGAPLRDQHGKLRGAVFVLHDVTRETRLQEDLQRASKLKSIGVLAGGIAHDFNNLLAAIAGNLSLARLPETPSSQVNACLVDAESAALRAKGLTQQLLTFAKGGAPVKKLMQLGPLLAEASRFVLSGRRSNLVLDFPEGLWVVEADPGQVTQVMHNLVINADQSMPSGGTITVQARNEQVSSGDLGALKPGSYVCISVRDEGAGIPQSVLPRIFDPFFTTRSHGSGLGLASAQSILKAHQGLLTVESEEGQGSVFYVWLAASPNAQALAPESAPLHLARRLKVLVVDDEDLLRQMLAKMLAALGHMAMSASTAAEAMALYRDALRRDEPFDVCVLDMTMPGDMSGKELMRALQEIHPRCCAVASSGYANDPVMSEYENFGFSGCLAKPYRMDELKTAIMQAHKSKQVA